MRTTDLKISKLNHHGTTQFRVNFGLHSGGKRWFPTETEAKAAIKAFKTEQRRIGELAGKLSAAQANEMIEAERSLEGTGISVLEAVQLAKAELEKHLSSETFGRALDEYYEHCKREHKRKLKDSPRKDPKHVWAIGQTRSLFKNLRQSLLSEITAEDLEKKLDREKPSQFNKHVAHLKAIFNYAKRKKWLQENPVNEIKKEAIHAREGRAFKPAEVEKLMDTLVEHDRDSIPYYALIFFAGLRPDTAFKLDWSALENGTQIQIRRTVSKTPKAFPVTITPTLQAWIDWWVAQGGVRKGPIHPKSAKTRSRNRATLCELSGIKWIQDAPRRTFGTSHYQISKNAAHAAMELGHMGGAEVFYSHYYDGSLTPGDAKKFWNIRPPAKTDSQ